MPNLPAKSLLFLALAIAWMGAISYLSARTEPLAMLPASVQKALGAPAWDSRVPVAAHLGLFAILGFLFIGAIAFWRRLVRAAVFILVCTLTFAIIDEVHQRLTPGRDSSVVDVAVDMAGVAFALAIWLIMGRIVGQREPTKKTTQRKSIGTVTS